jgi:hypothetical protein
MVNERLRTMFSHVAAACDQVPTLLHTTNHNTRVAELAYAIILLTMHMVQG